MTEENDPFASEPIPRRVKPIIFMIATSASMAGNRIAAVNTAVHEFLYDNHETFKHKMNQIKIGALEYSSGVSWMYDQLIEAESFQWQDFTTGGQTSFGAACEALNSKLSRSRGWMNEPTGIGAPTIILTTDGSPTDEWEHALEKLKSNPWFKVACKMAIAIGEGADEYFLGEFIGDIKSVVRVHNGEQLKKVIYAACVVAINEDSSTQQLLDFIHADHTLSRVDVGPGAPVEIFSDTDEIIFWCCRGYIEPNWDSDYFHIEENSILLKCHREGKAFESHFDFCKSYYTELLTVLRSLNLKLISEGARYSELYNAKGLKLYRNGEMYFSCYLDEDGRNFVSNKPLDLFENKIREYIIDCESIMKESVREE